MLLNTVFVSPVLVSSSGVDNSIAELKGAPREVMHLESGDDSQEFTYNRSTSFLSENEKGQSQTPPSGK